MKKIADSSKFPCIKMGKYYVFEDYMVLRQEDGIYATDHSRDGEKSIVDTFEDNYKHLGLEYAFIGDLDGENITSIRDVLSRFIRI